MTRFLRAALLAFAIAAVSACGFQLRGSGQSTLPFGTMYVTQPALSPLGAELRRYLRASGNTRLVEDPQEAQAILDVLAESRERGVLSLNSQGRIRELNLIYRVRFRVRTPAGAELLAPTEVALTRDISFNESQVLAKEREEEILYRDMQSDAVQQILRRLAALNPT